MRKKREWEIPQGCSCFCNKRKERFQKQREHGKIGSVITITIFTNIQYLSAKLYQFFRAQCLCHLPFQSFPDLPAWVRINIALLCISAKTMAYEHAPLQHLQLHWIKILWSLFVLIDLDPGGPGLCLFHLCSPCRHHHFSRMQHHNRLSVNTCWMNGWAAVREHHMCVRLSGWIMDCGWWET